MRTVQTSRAATGPLRSLAIALLLGAGLAGCSRTSSNQELREDYVAIKGALESYARANGEYPDQLTQLTEPDRRGRRHLEDTARLTDPYGNPYTYTPPIGARPPVIKSHGDDGVEGGDDIDLARMPR